MHPRATIRYYASEMMLKIHSDASYLSEVRARSCTQGHFSLDPFLVNTSQGKIYVHSGILKFVVASAAEAELGALFPNTKEGKIL